MISFPRLECWNSDTKVATVAAQEDKTRILCRISLDTLINRFDASEDAPMQSVSEHRSTIQEAARNLIENESFEEDGSVFIRASDI